MPGDYLSPEFIATAQPAKEASGVYTDYLSAAGQGDDKGRPYPWGWQWRKDATPPRATDNNMPDPPTVGSFPAGESEAGVSEGSSIG